MKGRATTVVVALITLFAAAPSEAALTTFANYTGTVGVSTDGWGSAATSGTVSASVPVGATVVAAFLYTATWGNPGHVGVSSDLNGTPVVYGAPVTNPDICCSNSMARADVTAIVASVIDGGPAVSTTLR